MAATDIIGTQEGASLDILAATVQEILHDGSSGQPWRAIVRTRDGAMLFVASQAPLQADPGDDIHAVGAQRRSERPGLPDLFVMAGSGDMTSQARGILQNSELRSFGELAPGQRPAALALASCLGGDAALAVERRPDGTSVVRPPRRSADPSVRWAARFIRNAGASVTVALCDPHAFLPRETDKGTLSPERLARTFDRLLDRQILSGQKTLRRHLHEVLPQALRTTISVIAPELQAGSGIVMRGGSEPGDEKNAPFRSLVPFSAIETSAALLNGMSWLPGSQFAPRETVPVAARRAFVALHEAAHTLESDYLDQDLHAGRSLLGSTILSENFADAAAALEYVRVTGDAGALRPIADARRICALFGGTTHLTADSFEQALKVGLGLHASGANESDAAMQASSIALEYAPAEDDIARLSAARERIWARAGIQPVETDNGLCVIDEDRARALEATRTLAADPDFPLEQDIRRTLRLAVEAADRSYAGPAELARPDVMSGAVDRYGRDVAETLGSAGASPATANLLRRRERALLSLPSTKTLGLPIRLGRRNDYRTRMSERLDVETAAAFGGSRGADGRSPQAIPPATQEAAFRNASRGARHNQGDHADAAHAARNAVVVVPASPTRMALDLSEAFSRSPENRVAAYVDSLRREYHALTRALRDPEPSFDEANGISYKRRLLAFAIRVDDAAWARVPGGNDSAARRAVEVHATTEHIPYTVGDAEERRRMLRVLSAELGSPLPDIAIGKKPSVTARPAQRGAAVRSVPEEVR